MASSAVGKLLELIEKVVVAVERRDRMRVGMIKSDIQELKRDICAMKEWKEYK